MFIRFPAILLVKKVDSYFHELKGLVQERG